jgi:hypothetical protein
MANPSITGSVTVKSFGSHQKISTTATENLLMNAASSGKLVRVHSLSVHNIDGTNAATFTLDVYDQDGTGMSSQAAANGVAIGSDTVAGSSLGGFKAISVAGANALVVIDTTMNFVLLEDQSLVFTASAANDLSVSVMYSTIG